MILWGYVYTYLAGPPQNDLDSNCSKLHENRNEDGTWGEVERA